MENEKEGRFSYTSPDLQRKNALKVLGIEAIIILIVVVIIFAALSYVGILRITDIVNLFNSKVSITSTQNIANNSKTFTDSNKRTIVINSGILNYNIFFKNPQALSDYLDKIGVWGYQSTVQGVIQPPIESVSINLTDKIQPNNQFKAEKTGVYMSADVDPQNGRVVVHVYLSPFILGQSESRRGEFLDQVVITALYRVAHRSLAADTAQESKNLQEIYSEMGAKNITFFDVKSN